jgi:hypothetical protein
VATAGDVDRVDWVVDGEPWTTGGSSTFRWSPGTHTLRAEVTYTDGATETATFPDGTTRVVADPRPSVSVPTLRTDGQVGGDVVATDGFDNLRSVTVSAPGLDERRRWTAEDGRFEGTFDWESVEPGREYELVVTATDERGQEVTVERSVTAVGTPRVRSAGFVTGPVDSYHPRIDQSRYTAHHVLRIELNGHSVGGIETVYEPEEESTVRRVAERKVAVSDGVATVHTYWAADSPSDNGDYTVQYAWRSESSSRPSAQGVGYSNFTVTPSDPELRIRMLNDGGRETGDDSVISAPAYLRNRIYVDATGSFDPDGTSLTYVWDNGATASNRDDAIGILSGVENGRLIIEDDSGARVYQNWSAQQTYVPAVASTEVLGSGPFRPDERVRVAVRTQKVIFRRNAATLDIDAELVGAPGSIVEWTELRTADENEFRYEGVIELPASALAGDGSTPRIELVNSARSEYARESTALPRVELTDAQRTGRAALTVTDLRYAIRERVSETAVADSRSEMRQLRNGGYEVVDTETETVEHRIERRVQVSEAETRTETRTFGSSYARRLFLKTRPDWQADGTRTDYRRVAERSVSWKRTRGSAFTGETRRVLTDPAEYDVLREYEYTTTEPRTREVTSRQCLPRSGCYEVTYERTVYRPVTHSYWAHSRQSRSHSATGDVRRTLVDPAEYATEYRHEYTSWDVEVDREYVASHTTVVQRAEYEWQTFRTVTSGRTARQLTTGYDDRRVAERVTERRWTMERRDTEIVVRPAYTADDEVVETRATVEGNLVRYRTSGAGLETARVVGRVDVAFAGRGILDESEIKERVRESEGSG